MTVESNMVVSQSVNVDQNYIRLVFKHPDYLQSEILSRLNLRRHVARVCGVT